MAVKSVSIHGVYFDSRGRVLLIKDSNSLLWGFPGGKIEKGETHKGALHREFLEETGMRIQGSLTYLTRLNDNIKQRYFYRVKGIEGHLNEQGNDEDVGKAAYFDMPGLPLQNLAPGVESIIQRCRN